MDPAARRPSGRAILRFIMWFGLLAGAAFGLAPAASASPGWTSASPYPTPLGETVSQAATGFASGGTATIAFIETGSGAPVLHVGTVAPGTGYTEQLSVGASGGAAPVSLSLSVADDGAAVLGWELAGSGAPTTYEAAVRPAGSSSWGSPVTVAVDAAGSAPAVTPRIVTAIAPDGTSAAAAEHPDPSLSSGGERIDALTFSPSGTPQGPTQLATAGVSATDVGLGFDAGDLLTATFLSGGALEQQTWSGGAWATPSQIASAAQPPVAIGVAPDGSVAVAFDATSSGPLDLVTRSNGAWSAPLQLAASGGTPLAAGLASDDTPYVLSADAADGCTALVRYTGAPAGGCIAGSTAGASGGAIAFLGTTAYVGWTSASLLEGSSWGAGDAAPAPATTLDSAAAPGQSLAGVAADGEGGIGVLWTTGGAIRAAAFDAGPPILLASEVPAKLPALQTTSFSTTFTDLWSGVTSITWNFGDGTPTTTGALTSHAYAHPGAYSISATATDGFGNAATQSFAVTVGPPSPRLSRVAQSTPAWRPRHGTVFRFAVSEAVRVTLTFTTAARSPRRVGVMNIRATRGLHRLPFHGRIGSLSRLRPGRYRVSLVAFLDGEASATKTLAFTVLPSPRTRRRPVHGGHHPRSR